MHQGYGQFDRKPVSTGVVRNQCACWASGAVACARFDNCTGRPCRWCSAWVSWKSSALPNSCHHSAIASLTAAAVRVYEEICTLARLNRGRVFPTYDHLARATALGRATVARALHVLEAIGFLVRQRRFKRVEGEGPRYRQTSNVYRPTPAARVLPYLPRWLRPVPIPDDQMEHDAARAAAHAEMLGQLSCRELGQALVGGALGRVLAKLGARIDAAVASPVCESQNRPQPLAT